jgi:hypothetical protein
MNRVLLPRVHPRHLAAQLQLVLRARRLEPDDRPTAEVRHLVASEVRPEDVDVHDERTLGHATVEKQRGGADERDAQQAAGPAISPAPPVIC